MTYDQESRCHAIIHGASATCALPALLLSQFPGSDNAVIVPIQVGMTISLGQVFGKSLTEGAALAALATAATSIVGRGISQALVGWVPLAGNIINASTAAAVTEAAGWVLANDFARDSEAA